MSSTEISRGPGLAEKVSRALLEEITGGSYEVGDWLPSEQTLADRFGVSRTVLREAISKLKSDGLVRGRQGRGVMVISNRTPQIFALPSDSDHHIDSVLQVVELRLGIEAEAAGLAALRRDDRDLEKMRAAIEQMSDAIAGNDVASGVEADLRFHRVLCEATKNPHYLSFYEFLSQFIRENISVSRHNSARRRQRSGEAQSEHTVIFNAIEAGDAEAARAASRQHIENTSRRLADVSRENN